MDDKVYTIKDAAQKANYSERQIRQWCIDGKLTGAYKIAEGRKWLIPESALAALNVSSQGQQKAIAGEIVKQVPYLETTHKQEMRELAGKLINEISLPEIQNSFIVDWKPGPIEYVDSRDHRLFPPIRIAENETISVDIAIEGNLRSHLETGGFSDVIGEIDNWKSGLGQYLRKCHDFSSLPMRKVKVQAKFPDDAVERNEKVGYQKAFFTSACADAIEIAIGNVRESGYWRQINAYSLWNLTRCGKGSIYIANTESEANERQCEHQGLVAGFSETKEAKEIVKVRQDLELITEKIRERLQTFRDMQCACGHCELCPPLTARP
ncbi:MAG: helix-turn-helix domain-containing protein [Chloroflexi bacterium]|nr:helix-turn-helix domain-containing protein [Chloroflexota bacterium]